MKKKLKIFLVTFTVSLFSLLIFLGVGFFYLQGIDETVENKSEKVPFYQFPESKGLLFHIGESKILFYMNFEGNALSVVYLEGEEYQNEIYGYGIDYTVKTDHRIVEEIVDNLGGLDLDVEGQVYNYTGMQVVEFIEKTEDKALIKRTVTEKVIEKIGDKGMALEDFVYIIENSETELTVPDCYFWPEYMGEICKNVRFVNP